MTGTAHRHSGRARLAGRLAAVAIAVAAVVMVPPRTASAHAVLLATDPVDQTRLAAVPERVTLEFNEPVSVATGGVRVYDGEARRIDDGEPAVTGPDVSVEVADDLDDGAFVVTWRGLSADGHAVRGAFTFTVGAGASVDESVVARLLDEGADRPWEIAAAVSRFLAYGGVLLAAGGVLFLAVVHDGGADRKRLARIVVVAALVGAVGVVVALPVQAALATGLGPTAITADGAIGDVLGDGVGWSVATALVGLGLVVASVGRSSSRSWKVAGLVGAGMAAASFAFSGHTRVGSPAWLATGADIVHVVAVATWFGGLVMLAVSLVLRRGRPVAERAVLIARFSALAAFLLAAVLAAGLTLAWSEVRALRALTSTTYGWLVVAKVAIVAVVVGVAAWNRWGLLPALVDRQEDDGEEWAASRLTRTITVEAVGLVLVVAVTALLVNATPARVEAGVGTTFSTTVPLGDGSANVVVDPNRVGRNALHLYLTDGAGRPISPQDLTVELSLPAADIGPLRRRPVDIGSGHWFLDTEDLSIGGRWRIELVAQMDRFT